MKKAEGLLSGVAERTPAEPKADATKGLKDMTDLGRVLINRQPNAGGCAARRPLLGVKRTWRGLVSMSAYDPKRTFNP
jgi:hypothetical protein